MASGVPMAGMTSTKLRNICLQYASSQLEAYTNGFHASRRLGSGTTGTVYRGELPDGSEVAVKVIDLAGLGEDAIVAGFEDEIAILSKFRHPNLVVLIGWAREGTRRFLIYEYLTGGDVFQKLRKNREPGSDTFPWYERLAAARDAATGLAHLHNAEPHAFHRDVKSANILLSGNGMPAKMADFGLSCVAKSKDKDMMCEFPSGTPGYTCPMYIRSGKVTEGSEVYSFGMVVLELLMNQLPAAKLNGAIVYPILENVRPHKAGALQRVTNAVDPTAQWPPAVVSAVATLALACVKENDMERPRFTEVCQTLRAIQNRFPSSTTPDSSLSLPPSNSKLAPASMEPRRPHRSGNSAHGPLLSHQPPVKPQPDKFLQAKPHAPTADERQVVGGTGNSAGSSGMHVSADWSGSSSPDNNGAPTVRGAPTSSSPATATDEWPGGVDVVLEVSHIKNGSVVALPLPLRRYVLAPALNADGRRVVRIGRNCQSQWFETLITEISLRNSISRVACEIAWGGRDPTPTLRVFGNTIVVDDQIVAKEQTVSIHNGSSIRFMYQTTTGDFSAFLSLIVRCVHTGPSSTRIERSVTPVRRNLTPTAAMQRSTTPLAAGLRGQSTTPRGMGAPVGIARGSRAKSPRANPLDPPIKREGSNLVLCGDSAMTPGQCDSHSLLDNSTVQGLSAGGGSNVVLAETAVPPNWNNIEVYRRASPPQPYLEAPQATPFSECWQFECLFAAGLGSDALAFLPAHVKSICFPMMVGGPAVVIGRQRQMTMFEALLTRQKALLARVSRHHLQLDAICSGGLRVTNLSLNIVIAGGRVLWRNDTAQLHNGEMLSFAAATDMVPGAETFTVAAIDGVEKVAIAPFLSFRLSVLSGTSVVTEAG